MYRVLAIALLAICCQLLQRPLCSATDWLTYLGGNERAGFVSTTLTSDLNPAWIYRSPSKPEKAWSGSRTTPIEGHVMLPRVTFDASPQMIIVGDKLYFGSTVDHSMHCVNADSGQPLWSFYTDGPIRLAPTIAHENIYFGSDDGFVYCLAANNGSLVWKKRVGPTDDRLLARGEMISRWPVRTGVLIDGDIAYFGAGVFPHETVYMAAVNAHTGDEIWFNDRISQEDAGRNDLSPQGYLLANADHLFVPSGRSLPVAISKQTGEIVFQKKYSWRTDAGGVVGGTKAVLGDGQIYAGGPHHFLAMDENTGEIGQAYIGGRMMVLSENFAYLLDGEKVFCVDRAEHAKASQLKQQWFLRARSVQKDKEKLAEAKQKIEEYAGVGILWELPCSLDGAMIATQDLLIVGGANQVIAIDRQSGEKRWESSVEGNAMGLAANDSVLSVSTDEGLIYTFTNQPVASVSQWPTNYSDPFTQHEQLPLYRQAAQEILAASQQTTGFCLVLGNEEGLLALELARQSDLQVIAVEPDPVKAEESRRNLEQLGIHGTRVTVVNAPLENLPFSNYFANLIVSDSHLASGSPPCSAAMISRFIKPCGGMVMMGQPAALATSPTTSSAVTTDWFEQLFSDVQGSLKTHENWLILTRSKLPGVGEWTHQYGDAANTSFSNDQRVRDGLGVLWYGDPGPSAMINRHEAAGAPLSTNGRMFIQGTDKVMAYDAYNGNFLWELENPGAIRTGVFNNRETHNLAATDDYLFMAIDNTCQQLDAGSGQLFRQFVSPESSDGLSRAWAFLAVDGNQLFGSNTIRVELEEKMRRRGLTVSSQTDSIFAYDLSSGALQWTYHGDNLLHTTIAISPQHVFFIESSLSPEERQELYRRDKTDLKELSGEDAAKAEQEMKRFDARIAVCLDRMSGKKIWEKAIDVTDTTNVSAGGGNLTVIYSSGHLLLCGANANGHYWKQFLAGEFEKRKLIVLDAATGAEIWSKNANYMNRPAIVNGQVFAEPWAFDLKTGETKKRPHPLTGEASDWRFSRPGHHCGIITATPNMMFFRSGFIGYYDLYKDSGTQHFSGQRLGCWVNAIPGNGLVMIPEASAGCVCQFSIASTVVLEPKSSSKAWGIFSAVGTTTPVKRMGINLGAPGDRVDDARREWIGFPRPKTVERLEFVLDIAPQFTEGGGWYSDNPDNLDLSSGELPWVFASGARGLTHCQLPLLGPNDQPAHYAVRLYFAGLPPDEVQALPIQLQGSTPTSTTSLWSTNSNATFLTVREFNDVPVQKDLVLSAQWQGLSDRSDSSSLPLLCAIEVIRIESDPAAPDNDQLPINSTNSKDQLP